MKPGHAQHRGARCPDRSRRGTTTHGIQFQFQSNAMYKFMLIHAQRDVSRAPEWILIFDYGKPLFISLEGLSLLLPGLLVAGSARLAYFVGAVDGRQLLIIINYMLPGRINHLCLLCSYLLLLLLLQCATDWRPQIAIVIIWPGRLLGLCQIILPRLCV